MRQRNVKNQDKIIQNSDKYVLDIEDLKSYINKKRFNKLCLEIGIGKGAFIFEKARLNPDDLFIGIELSKGVVSLACKKIKRLEEEKNLKLDNLKVTAFNALDLEQIFDFQQVDIVYLNFSDPWPKKKHEKRRLTSDGFLEVYKKILKEEGKLEVKTDNRKLFEYSIINFNKNNMIFDYININLHEDIKDGKIVEEEINIMTEYEEKFKDKGPIYKMIVKFRRN